MTQIDEVASRCYFFHIADGQTVYCGEDGLCLPGPAAALNEARTSAWALTYDLAQNIADRSKWRVEVTDERQRTAVVLPFHMVLRSAIGPKVRSSADEVVQCIGHPHRIGHRRRGLERMRSGVLTALPMVCIVVGLLWALPAGARPGARVEPEAREVSAEVTPVPVAGPLEFPWSIGFLPDGAVLVTERPGRLQLIRAGSVMQEISGIPPVLSDLHAGLLDVAVDPNFAQTGTLYLSYVHGTEVTSTIRVLKARLDLTDNALVDQQVIFESDPPAASLEQLGGRLALTGNGYLLLTLGDRWEGRRAQDLSDHAGSIIRIRVDGSVPEDNPFVSVPDAKPEIWTYGHRNPQGLAIERMTGQVWSVEHGPRGGDELNRIEGGLNYGWPIITYGVDYEDSPIGLGNAASGLEQPVHQWTPSIAPSGLVVEQDGNQLKVWVGALAGQTVVQFTRQHRQMRGERHLFEGALGRVRDIRRGPDNVLYVITDDPAGWLYQLQPTTEQVEHDDAREPL